MVILVIFLVIKEVEMLRRGMLKSLDMVLKMDIEMVVEFSFIDFVYINLRKKDC